MDEKKKYKEMKDEYEVLKGIAVDKNYQKMSEEAKKLQQQAQRRVEMGEQWRALDAKVVRISSHQREQQLMFLQDALKKIEMEFKEQRRFEEKKRDELAKAAGLPELFELFQEDPNLIDAYPFMAKYKPASNQHSTEERKDGIKRKVRGTRQEKGSKRLKLEGPLIKIGDSEMEDATLTASSEVASPRNNNQKEQVIEGEDTDMKDAASTASSQVTGTRNNSAQEERGKGRWKGPDIEIMDMILSQSERRESWDRPLEYSKRKGIRGADLGGGLDMETATERVLQSHREVLKRIKCDKWIGYNGPPLPPTPPPVPVDPFEPEWQLVVPPR